MSQFCDIETRISMDFRDPDEFPGIPMGVKKIPWGAIMPPESANLALRDFPRFSLSFEGFP